MQHAKQYFEVAKCDLQTLKQVGELIIHWWCMVMIVLHTEVFTLEDIQSWDIEAKENISSQPCTLS